MKVAYVLFVRDKAHLAQWVEKSVRSAFAQTYAPMEIVLSDQGSTDGTRELLARLAAEYAGPNTLRLLDCPRTERHGMAGMNDHLEWLHDELDCDIFIPATADDYAPPQRAARLVEAFERTGADMVGGVMTVEDPYGKAPTVRSSHAREGWVSVTDTVAAKVGGSSAPAWRTALWKRVRPIPATAGCDVWLPPLACALGGFWFINEVLYTRLEHADVKNTGLEGVLKALPEDQQRPVHETIRFQTARAWAWTVERMCSLNVGTHEDRSAARKAVNLQVEGWLAVRDEMALAREAPQAFPI